MVRKPPDQISPTPRDMEQWAMEKAKNRGISTQELAGANLNLHHLSNGRARIFRGE